MKEATLVIALMIIGVLIVLKSDQQSIRMLEGKLYKLGQPINHASIAYRRHLTRLSLAQFLVGMGLMAMTIILWVNDDRWLALASGVVAAALCGFGAWQRIRAFMAADADLSD